MKRRTGGLLFLLFLSAGAWLATALRMPERSEFDPGISEGEGGVTIRLVPVMEGFSSPTDVEFVPGEPGRGVLLEKGGRAQWFDLDSGEQGTLLELEVRTRSEQGLLGMAFHPDYPENPCLFLHYSPEGGERRGRVSEWCGQTGAPISAQRFREQRVVMEQAQPYANHNAGALAFGPDGMLYVPWGDGGSGGDPLGHGQNPETFLGSILRLDVDGGRPYRVPADNPFTQDPSIPDETWAYGFRNPWRISFAPDGRLLIADVGQNHWEEIHAVTPGGNHGWNHREGHACFPPKDPCVPGEFVEPLHSYDHSMGRSITGGHVLLSEALPALKGHYLFGDYVSGRLWALPLDGSSSEPLSLGKWPIFPATFGRDSRGESYVLDHARGTMFQLSPDQASPG